MEVASIKISSICSVEIKEHAFSYELIITTLHGVQKFKGIDGSVFSTKRKIDDAIQHYLETGEDDILEVKQTSYFPFF